MDTETQLSARPAGMTRRRFLQRAGLAGIGAAGLIATASISGLADDGHEEADRSTGVPAHSRHPKTDTLHDAMRRIWEDHIAWTRLFIVSFAAGLGDTELVAGRLLRNQDEIGDMFRPVFGDEAGDAVTALLHDHILGAAAILAAAKAGDSAGAQAAIEAWYANGDDIARALSELNPDSWPFDEMSAMMRAHLDPTLQEGVARLEGRFADGIAIWDTIHDQALMMADMLTDGLRTAPRPGRL
jgi:hypothetical protein